MILSQRGACTGAKACQWRSACPNPLLHNALLLRSACTARKSAIASSTRPLDTEFELQDTLDQPVSSSAVDVIVPEEENAANALATSSQHAAADRFYDPDYPLERFIGPFYVQADDETGLGFVATRDVEAGELLLVCPPIAILHSTQEGSYPDGQQLVKHMMGNCYTQQDLAWLQLLYAGDDSSSSASSSSSGSSTSSRPDSADSSALSEAPSASTSMGLQWRFKQAQLLMQQGSDSNTQQDGYEVCPYDHDVLLKKSNLNSYGNPIHDPAVAESRGLGNPWAGGHIGIWPEFSLLNHSCAPNTSYWVSGDMMVVRAARDIAAGEEVTISYFGRQVLQPLSERQQYLKAAYGFHCRCPRCQFEENLPYEISEVIQRTNETCAMMKQVLEEAIEQKDRKVIDGVAQMVDACQQILYTVCGDDIDIQQLLWLEASMYSMHEVYLEYFAADDNIERLGDCLDVAAAVAPGSDLHVLLAIKKLVVASRPSGFEYPPELVAEAEEECYAAHVARYGCISTAMFSKLLKANMMSRYTSAEASQQAARLMDASRQRG